MAAILAAIVGAFAATLPANDPDLFWHLASGIWMLDHRQLLDRDVFSFTMDGSAYSVGQWLGEVVYALLYRAGGWLAISGLRAALVGVAAFFVSRIVLRYQPSPLWAIVPLIGTLLVSKLVWGDRPQLFSLALFPVFLYVALDARFDGHPRRALALVPLSLLWANLHGAFSGGIALLGLVALESWISRASERHVLALAFAASAAAALVNPAGFGAYGAAAGYASSTSLVAEERPLDVATGAGAVFAALLLGTLGVALITPRGSLHERLGSPLLWAMLAVPFAALGMLHQRQLPFAAMILAPILAALLPTVFHRRVAVAPLVPRVPAVLIVASCVLVASAVTLVAGSRAPDLSMYPAGAVELLRARPGNLFDEYDWGGYLIFALPEHPTYIDGRGAALYPPSLITEFQNTVGLRPGYRETLDRRDIRLVLVRPDRALATALRNERWVVLGEEPGKWVLLERL